MNDRRSKPRKPPSESFGQRLARFRQERGITQVELAQRLGIGQTHVSAYERDHVRLHANAIVKLAQILSVSADELLGLEEPPRDQPLNRALVRHLRILEKLPVRDRDLILAMIRGRALERGVAPDADGEAIAASDAAPARERGRRGRAARARG